MQLLQAFKTSKHLKRLWSDDRGVLSFEWVVVITLLVIGIVGGLAAVRDATIDELGDVAEGVTHFNQSFHLPGNERFGIPDVDFTDQVAPYSQGDSDNS